MRCVMGIRVPYGPCSGPFFIEADADIHPAKARRIAANIAKAAGAIA